MTLPDLEQMMNEYQVIAAEHWNRPDLDLSERANFRDRSRRTMGLKVAMGGKHKHTVRIIRHLPLPKV